MTKKRTDGQTQAPPLDEAIEALSEIERLAAMASTDPANADKSTEEKAEAAGLTPYKYLSTLSIPRVQTAVLAILDARLFDEASAIQAAGLATARRPDKSGFFDRSKFLEKLGGGARKSQQIADDIAAGIAAAEERQRRLVQEAQAAGVQMDVAEQKQDRPALPGQKAGRGQARDPIIDAEFSFSPVGEDAEENDK